MQQFKFSIRHIPGRENTADALSRLPVYSAPDAAIKQTEEYARTIVADAIPAALAPRQVERESERAEWQILLGERCAHRKLREKEYADSKKHATTSDIAEGDMILLRQNRENKLSPTFEPELYRVVENGNSVIIENLLAKVK